MATGETVLEARDLSRVVDTPEGPRKVVDGISCGFGTGELYSLLGPSGAGKTSFLRLLNRLDEPTGGSVVYEGEDTSRMSPCRLRRHVGFLFQTPHVFDGSVSENLRYAEPDLSEEDIASLLGRAGLDRDKASMEAARLSVGEKQRVALARLLAAKPHVLLLDEPTSALDPASTADVEKTIISLMDDSSITVIMVSHHPKQALRLGGRALLLHRGALVESGPVGRLLQEPATDIGRRYAEGELR